jgi:WD40 repeat protein
MKTLRFASLLPILSLMTQSAAFSQEPPRTDRHGDPLPKGALERLGTVRFFEPDGIDAFAFSPDGKTYAVCGRTWASKKATVGLWNTATGKAIHRCPTDAWFFGDVAFAPDGKTVAAASNCDVFFFDVTTGNKLRRFEGHPGGIECLAWSPDGKMLAVGGSVHWTRDGDGAPNDKHPHTVRVIDAETGKLIREFEERDQPVFVVAFSADGQRLLTSNAKQCVPLYWAKYGIATVRMRSELVSVWDTATGAKLHHFARGVWRRTAVDNLTITYSADLTRVAFMGPDEKVQAWDIATGTKCLVPVENARWSFTFSPDGKYLVFSTDGGGPISLWDANTGKHVRDFMQPSGSAFTIAGIDPTGKYVAAVSGTSTSSYRPTYLHLWNLASGKELTGQHGHQAAITFVQASPDGKRVVTGGQDRTVRLWDSATGQPGKVLSFDNCYWVSQPVLSQNSKTVATVDDQGVVRLLDVPEGKRRALKTDINDLRYILALSPDGTVMAVSDQQERVFLLDAQVGKKLAALSVWSREMCFSPDGRVLATLGRNGSATQLQLWHSGTGKLLHTFQPPGSGFNEAFFFVTDYRRTLAFSADGRWLVVCEAFYSRHGWYETKLFLWEVATGQLLREIAKVPSSPTGITFGPDGFTLVANSGNSHADRADGAATFWDLPSGQLLGKIQGHIGDVTAVAFAPDGRTFFTGGRDGTALVWDAAMLPRAKPSPPRKLSPAELTALWIDLAGTNARKAYDAIVTLSASGKDSVAF